MDSWFQNFGMDNRPLAFHDALEAPKEAGLLPSYAFRVMIAEFERGRMTDGLSHEHLVELSEEHQPVVAFLLQGAFLSGLSSRGLDDQDVAHRDKNRVMESCSGLKKFVRAFLAMDPKDRERTFVKGKSSRYRMLEVSIVGALSEARVATALLDAGLTVLESTVEEDMNLGVDMIVPSSDETVGHVVQSKTDRERVGIQLRPVERQDAEADPSGPDALLWQKAGSFNLAYGIRYAPILAVSGTRDRGLFSFRDAEEAGLARIFFEWLRDPDRPHDAPEGSPR